MKPCALFDFDGTITTRDTTPMLVRLLAAAQPGNMVLAAPHLLAMRLASDEEVLQRSKYRAIGALLRGHTLSSANALAEQFATQVRPLYRHCVVERLRDCVRKDYRVLVVTASPAFAVRRALEGESVCVLGAEFTVSEGRYLGRVNGNGCYGDAKVAAISDWRTRRGEDVRFAEAWSDSLADLPMMRLAQRRFWLLSAGESAAVAMQDPDGTMISASAG